jgi:hypothetical protein
MTDHDPLSIMQHQLASKCTFACLQVRKVLFQPSKLSKYMGMDVTSLMSVPLFIMEPFSMLQKMAEIMEYTNLLDQANASEDPYERCACWAVLAHSSPQHCSVSACLASNAALSLQPSSNSPAACVGLIGSVLWHVLTTVCIPAAYRVALVAAFLVSPFGAAERTWKPFNPVLGETFEADKLQNDAFFVAEQVRTGPGVLRAHALFLQPAM